MTIERVCGLTDTYYVTIYRVMHEGGHLRVDSDIDEEISDYIDTSDRHTLSLYCTLTLILANCHPVPPCQFSLVKVVNDRLSFVLNPLFK